MLSSGPEVIPELFGSDQDRMLENFNISEAGGEKPASKQFRGEKKSHVTGEMELYTGSIKQTATGTQVELAPK